MACLQVERRRHLTPLWRSQGACRRCGQVTAGKSSCERCLRLHNASQKRRSTSRRALVLSRYGGTCFLCPESRSILLCIDHVNGGGRKHRKEIGGPDQICKLIIRENFPKDYRLLCYNCNLITHFERLRESDLDCGTAQKAREYRVQLKREVLDHYGAVCPCGFSDIRALCLDHINGGGNKHHIELGGGGCRLYSWAKKNQFPPIFQVMCANCNAAKYLAPLMRRIA